MRCLLTLRTSPALGLLGYLALLVLAALPLSHAHPTKYPGAVQDAGCQNTTVLPTFYSFHIHVLFLGHSNQSTVDAMNLRQDFVDTFNPPADYCPSQYHQTFLCMFEPEFLPWGPFPTAQWAAFIPPEMMYQTVTWIMQRRQVTGWINAACTDPSNSNCGVSRPPFDVLIHPNSGCEYEDHGKWMMWAGTPWLLNMDAMDTETPFTGPGRLDKFRAPRSAQH